LPSSYGLTRVPPLSPAWGCRKSGGVHSIPANGRNRPAVPAGLRLSFWIACISYNGFQGLYYGIRSALFMDITTPAVAATQFTAYMAMQNFAISYTSTWQGFSIVRFGYPKTLVLDCVAGLLPLVLLPFMKPKKTAADPAQSPDVFSGTMPGAAIPEGIGR